MARQVHLVDAAVLPDRRIDMGVKDTARESGRELVSGSQIPCYQGKYREFPVFRRKWAQRLEHRQHMGDIGKNGLDQSTNSPNRA